jgi:hypothetical protein
MQRILESVSLGNLKKGRKERLWLDGNKYPALADKQAASTIKIIGESYTLMRFGRLSI